MGQGRGAAGQRADESPHGRNEPLSQADGLCSEGAGVIYTHIAAALIAAGIAFYSGWTTNQWRHDASQKQAVEAAAVAERELHAREQARSRAALDAQVMARKSEAVLRADAAASQSALVSLQSSTDAALRAAATDNAACLSVSTALGELFVASAGKYRGMAETADACVIELRAQLASP